VGDKMNGCELRKCQYWNGKICTDENQLYDEICRYNTFWQTEEGQERIEKFYNDTDN
jgi:hypothetical protein